MFNSIHEECGVFGIFENKTTYVARTAYLALYALQHRGQESCGIAVNDDGVFTHHRGDGLVPDVFTKDRLEALGQGNMAIGHVRYSTTGGKNHNNIQPLVIRHIKGNLAVAHNGNLVNAQEIRKSFELGGAIFHGTSDTESIAYAIVKERLASKSTEEAVSKVMNRLKGAYSCIVMTATKLIAFRDPMGFRPLCIGKTDGGAYVIASESCALDTIGAHFIRDIKPGEIVTVSTQGVSSDTTHCGGKCGLCVFEYIYFARPDSVIEGSSVQHARMKAGEYLAKESPVDADIVIGVPDSGLDAALGYSRESGIPYGIGFIKNKYIGRSFIQPNQDQREDAVRIKLNVIKENIKNKRVIMIDDSIVRGTTCARIVSLLREAGAKEVHMRVSSPPFKFPCYFGTDVDSRENLIACKYNTVDEIAEVIGVDSLAYLSVDATHHLAENTHIEFCDGCFTGNYPVEAPKEQPKDKFETKLNQFSAYYQVLD
ncbi:MAG TPA: amidophosphoribosyltransferase [Candidatus Eubacterium faecavium]|nr:amidophosphoribosyltransferase [Candidatus Eubacterium faecavium]